MSAGALVALVSHNECAQAGVIVATTLGRNGAAISFATWPLSAPTRFDEPRRSGPFGGRFPEHPYYVDADGERLQCMVRKLDRRGADVLRAQIGPVVPEEIREVFWSPAERQAIDADMAEQARYEIAVKDLLASL